MTTTLKHIKDNAEYVTLQSTVPEVKNVQQLFDQMGDWVFKDSSKHEATETKKGIRRLATQAEVDAGITNNIVTPVTLAKRLQYPAASEDKQGITRYTKNTEALTFANTTATTPKTIKYIFDNYAGTESRAGSSRVASTAQALSGVLDTVVITPLKLKQAIAAIPDAPVFGPATESVLGVVKLATVAQVRAGVIREGHAISPYTFANLSGNETQAGVFKVAKQGDLIGVADDLIITPKKLNAQQANTTTRSIVKLTSDVNNTDANTALKPSTNLMTKAGGVFTSDIFKTTAVANNKFLVSSEIDQKITLSFDQLKSYINDAVTNIINTKLLGWNQTWQSVSRNKWQVYTNDTGKPIVVAVRGHAGHSNAEIRVDGLTVAYISDGDKDGSWSYVSAIVPAGSQYQVNAGGRYAGAFYVIELR